MTRVTQKLSLEDTPKINSRFFSEGKTLCPLNAMKSIHRVSFMAELLVCSLLNVCRPISNVASGALAIGLQLSREHFRGCQRIVISKVITSVQESSAILITPLLQEARIITYHK